MGGFDWAMFSHWKKIDGQTLQLHFHTGQISVKGRGLFERLKTDPNTLCFLEHIKMKRVKEVWESGKEEAVMVDTVEVIFAE